MKKQNAMKKLLPLSLCLLFFLTACASAQPLTGQAKGYGGELKVSVTMEGDKITAVDVTENSETPAVAGDALKNIPAAIVEKNSADVDVVSGATLTSRAIMAAVKNAIDPSAYPFPENAETPTTDAKTTGNTMGLGVHSMGRIGPGKDSEDVPVYSFNTVIASAQFDNEGRIVQLLLDQLEVATPNYDGAGMPQLAGFPGQGGYNYDEAHNGTIAGKTPDTEDAFLADIDGWQTKRERGDAYRMGSGTWAAQMDKFQSVFIGKTVDEVDAWFKSYTSDVNGRPLKDNSEVAEDKAKYDKLSDEDKKMLADVISSATISLNDAHGNIIGAIRKAYDLRVPIQ